LSASSLRLPASPKRLKALAGPTLLLLGGSALAAAALINFL
jgi:hypothetical protein